MSLIPEGTYLARATSSALGFTKGGDPQIAIGFDISTPDGTVASRTWFGFFTEKSEPTTVKALAALGFDATTRSLMDLNPEDPMKTPVYGVECRVVIQHEDYQAPEGDMIRRDKIRWVNQKDGVGAAMKERMNPAQAAEFAAKFRARLGGGRPKAAAAAPRPAPAQEQTDFSDIPFAWFLPFLLLLS